MLKYFKIGLKYSKTINSIENRDCNDKPKVMKSDVFLFNKLLKLRQTIKEFI